MNQPLPTSYTHWSLTNRVTGKVVFCATKPCMDTHSPDGWDPDLWQLEPPANSVAAKRWRSTNITGGKTEWTEYELRRLIEFTPKDHDAIFKQDVGSTYMCRNGWKWERIE